MKIRYELVVVKKFLLGIGRWNLGCSQKNWLPSAVTRLEAFRKGEIVLNP